jgi:hypothetical protein
MNAHKKTAAKFTAMAFGAVILAISASTSFAFFYNYFSSLIPPGVLGPDVAALISGVIGTLLFDVAAVVWLQTYLNDARTPEQRAISLMMLIITFIGAAAASVAHLSLSATGELALDVATLDSIATVALVTVIIGVIANFGSTIAYQRFSYDNKQAVRESDREDEIQKAEDGAANELDALVSQKLKERLTQIAPTLADDQAARIAAQYQRREAAKYGSAETAVPPTPGYYVQVEDLAEESGWHTVNKRPFTTLDQADVEIDKYPTTRRRIVDQNGNHVLRNREAPQSARPTSPRQARAQANGTGGYNYPKRDGHSPE